MAKLIFNAADVDRVVSHALKATEFMPNRQEVDYPCVMLVHDDGVYLMSNGVPRDIVEGERSFAAYAEGCHPDKDPDCFETAAELVGGDDFVEYLPWTDLMAEEIDNGATHVVIEITGDEMEISFVHPSTATAQ
jgi:hypothetical protein